MALPLYSFLSSILSLLVYSLSIAFFSLFLGFTTADQPSLHHTTTGHSLSSVFVSTLLCFSLRFAALFFSPSLLTGALSFLIAGFLSMGALRYPSLFSLRRFFCGGGWARNLPSKLATASRVSCFDFFAWLLHNQTEHLVICLFIFFFGS